MKALLRHAGNINSEEFAKGLIEWRNTPKEHGRSPAEIMFGRQQRSIVPCPPDALIRPTSKEDEKWIEQCDKLEEKRRVHFDSRTKSLEELSIGDRVAIQDPVSKRWIKKGEIIESGHRRRYLVAFEDGSVKFRNRKFLWREFTKNGEEEEVINTTPQQPRHSERTRKVPDRFISE